MTRSTKKLAKGHKMQEDDSWSNEDLESESK